MITITCQGDNFHFEVLGMHKLWAFRSSLTIPVAHVRGVRKDPDAVNHWPGWRLLGTSLPGVIQSGTFFHHGERIFWDVSDPKQVIVVELNDESFQELVIEVEDPDAAIALLNQR